MNFYWLRFLLLSTFAFWATGAAKYTHEAIEHHGRDASIDDGDDDDDSSAAVVAKSAVPADPAYPPAKHPCPVCQMLAAMVVDYAAPPALPANILELVGTFVAADHITLHLDLHVARFARGPPVLICL